MSGLFKKPKTPKPPPVAPAPDDELDQISEERKAQRMYGRRGRAATALSEGNKLG